jgi:arylsulfatase A-like enzyme
MPLHSFVSRLRNVTLLSLAFFATLAHAAPQRPPNIVIILADDLGYGDLGCYGHPSIRTPNLDRMAAEGLRFTQFYSAAEVCTPSRAALLTGRLPIRSGMCSEQFRVLRTRSTGCLPADEITLAEALKPCGYATGVVGKWHLGVWSINPEGHPRKHGFDFTFGVPHSNDMDPFPGNPKGASGRLDQDLKWWNTPLYRNEEIVERPADQTKLTKRYTEEAVKFIRDNKARPFFLYFPHTFPHVPLFASPDFRGRSARGLYGDVVEELDWSVGQVLDTLRKEKLDDNTLVFFSSDNGPWLIMGLAGGSAGLLKEGKGSTWEGGMRVPGIAWWPGKIKPGVTRELAGMLDLFPTCVTLAGAALPKDRPLDGVDMAPILFGTGPSKRDSWLYYRGERLYAARQGPWKAHFLTRAGYGQPKADEHATPQLFNLDVDPGENHNVAEQNPKALEALAQMVEAHRATLGPFKSNLDNVLAPPGK